MERSRNRGDSRCGGRDYRPGLTGTSFLLLAIKAIMQCHTIRVPTLKYDKTIQMPRFRSPFLPNFHPLPLLDTMVSMRLK